MAELMAWPLNLAEYAYNAEDVQRWMAGKTSGVYGAEGNWQVVAKSGMQITVKAAGQVGGWLSNMGIHGVVFWNSTDIDLTVPTADGVNPRVDRVVVSWHIPQQTSVPTIEVRKGTAGSSPKGPGLVNDGEYAEICLAEIRLAAGQTEISPQHIVDTRMDSSLCGIVSIGVEKYPTDGLEAEFRDWLDNLKTNLDENTAANLLNNIETHKADTTVHFLSGEKSKLVQHLSHSKSGTVHALTGLSGISGLISCVFKATADFTTGDTFTVDGTAYTAQLSNGETAEDNLFVSGAAVSIIVDTGAKKVNFKSAGGGTKLPAGTTAIVKIFAPSNDTGSVSTTWIVPESGDYRITVIGKGGNGSDIARYQESNVGKTESAESGRSGGSGGLAIKTLSLVKGQSIPVTVNSAISSFGSYLSATAGGNSVASDYPASATLGVGGTASGGDQNFNGQSGTWNGNYGSSYNSSGYYSLQFCQGTPPRGMNSQALAASPFASDGKIWTSSGMRAYGLGGKGNDVFGFYNRDWYWYSIDEVKVTSGNSPAVQTNGSSGAVIVELGGEE